MDTLQQIFDLCLVPLLTVLTGFIISWLNAKKAELKITTDNEITQKYTTMIIDTVVRCVKATSQTYVDSLKGQNAFTKEAQEKAFQKTMDTVLEMLSDDAKIYIQETFGDLTTYLTVLIEQAVADTKKKKETT